VAKQAHFCATLAHGPPVGLSFLHTTGWDFVLVGTKKSVKRSDTVKKFPGPPIISIYPKLDVIFSPKLNLLKQFGQNEFLTTI